MIEKLKIALKMYDYRDTCKRFFKAEFSKKIEPYQDILKKVMEERKLDTLQSLLYIGKTDVYNNSDGMTQLLFVSAAVELLEPSV